ncbi:MAG TPA: hypothetical protein EYG02_08585 [Henriciella marina]|uniref:hypothetical protein n=1 Tax=Henriciella sp. TaxID=1968823 RepID=UPI0017974E56|nr:hypothetical protein [Henriciella sp.]HIG23111.1 hypothetical protein [Henriciella sp.]HIK65069.1 hypothetical protein [Henriciella marina]
MPGRKRDLIDHSYTAGWVGIRPEMKAKPMFQIDRVYSAGVHFAKEVAAVAAMVCVAFGPGITASAQQESRLSSIQPFSDLIEREMSILTLILYDDLLTQTDATKHADSLNSLIKACRTSEIGTACFALAIVFESMEPQATRNLHGWGCEAVYPSLEACRRSTGQALERSDAGAREQDLLSEGIVARTHVLAGNFGEKADGLDSLLNLCSQGSGFACTFLGDFNNNQYDRRSLLTGLKGGCDATYPDAYACHRRATLYSNGTAGEKDAALALHYAQKGCTLGWPDACTLSASLTQ